MAQATEQASSPQEAVVSESRSDSGWDSENEVFFQEELDAASEAELRVYARKELDLDLDGNDADLGWVAWEAFVAPPPDGWTEHVDDQGRVFFHNELTKESSWSHPGDKLFRELVSIVKALRAERPFPSAKRRSRHLQENLAQTHRIAEVELRGCSGPYPLPGGGEYYYNARLNESVWENPAERWERELAMRQAVLHRCLLQEWPSELEPPASQEETAADLRPLSLSLEELARSAGGDLDSAADFRPLSFVPSRPPADFDDDDNVSLCSAKSAMTMHSARSLRSTASLRSMKSARSGRSTRSSPSKAKRAAARTDAAETGNSSGRISPRASLRSRSPAVPPPLPSIAPPSLTRIQSPSLPRFGADDAVAAAAGAGQDAVAREESRESPDTARKSNDASASPGAKATNVVPALDLCLKNAIVGFMDNKSRTSLELEPFVNPEQRERAWDIVKQYPGLRCEVVEGRMRIIREEYASADATDFAAEAPVVEAPVVDGADVAGGIAADDGAAGDAAVLALVAAMRAPAVEQESCSKGREERSPSIASTQFFNLWEADPTHDVEEVNKVRQWLRMLGLARYFEQLATEGFDDMNILANMEDESIDELMRSCPMPLLHEQQLRRGLSRLRSDSRKGVSLEST